MRDKTYGPGSVNAARSLPQVYSLPLSIPLHSSPPLSPYSPPRPRLKQTATSRVHAGGRREKVGLRGAARRSRSCLQLELRERERERLRGARDETRLLFLCSETPRQFYSSISPEHPRRSLDCSCCVRTCEQARGSEFEIAQFVSCTACSPPPQPPNLLYYEIS